SCPIPGLRRARRGVRPSALARRSAGPARTLRTTLGCCRCGVPGTTANECQDSSALGLLVHRVHATGERAVFISADVHPAMLCARIGVGDRLLTAFTGTLEIG